MNLALPRSAPESLLSGWEVRAGERESSIGAAREKVWCTYVLDYRSFLCFYSNKWHSLYLVGRLDSLTVDENKYCMWFTLSCQRRGRARDGEIHAQRCYTFLALVTIVTSWWSPPPHLLSPALPPALPPSPPSSSTSPPFFFPAVTSAEWQHGCPGYRIILGDACTLEGGLLFEFFLILSSFLSQIASEPHSGYDNASPVV